jgi:hypothetical protein
MERLVVMSGKDSIKPSDLPINLKLPSPDEVLQRESLKAGIEDIEKSSILDALERTGWVQAKAARMLRITPRQIGYKMKKYGLISSPGSFRIFHPSLRYSQTPYWDIINKSFAKVGNCAANWQGIYLSMAQPASPIS